MHNFDNPGYLLAKTLRNHHYMMHKRFDGMGLHRGQPPLIMELYKHDGMTHSELSKKMEVTPATVTNMVKRMERDGLVVRRRVDEDERISRVYLTDEGKAMREKIMENIKSIESDIFEGFSEEEIKLFNSFMKRITKNLQNMY